MKSLKIAASRSCPDCFTTTREMVDVSASDYIDVAAVVLAISDISSGAIEEIEATGFGIPVFIATHKEEFIPAEYLSRIHGVFEYSDTSNDFYGRQLEAAAQKYETQLRPPFFRALVDYVKQGTARLTARGIRVASSSAAILPVISLSISLAKRFSAQICVTPTWQWAIC
jgi:ornithine decarboxylase